MKEDYRSGVRDRGRYNERDRPTRRSRSGSRSPLRSKVSIVAPLLRGRERERRNRSLSKSDRGNDRYDRKNKDRDDSRGRLRMDEQSRFYRGEHDYRDREVREDRNISLKRNSNSVFADLDRAVKKAREERNTIGYWNKKVIEVEEKDPNRWGHSGFKEMYSRDIEIHRSSKKDFLRRSRSRSRSNSNPRNFMGKRTPERHQVGRRSRSRSPMLKQLHKARQRNEAPVRMRPLLPKGFLVPRNPVKLGSRQKATSSTKRIKPLLSLDTSSPPKRINTFRSRGSPVERNLNRQSSTHLNRSSGGKGKLRSTIAKPRQRLGPSHVKRSTHNRRDRSAQRSFSGSQSGGSRTPSPKLRRPHSFKSDPKRRSSNRSVSKSRSRSRSRRRSVSRSRSSSSISSEDEDVLELHPRRRRSRSSISRSESSSSGSRSDTSGSSIRSDTRRRRDSGTSSSSSSSGSGSDHSTAMAKDKDRSARNDLLSPITQAKTAKSVQVPNQQVRQSIQSSKRSTRNEVPPEKSTTVPVKGRQQGAPGNIKAQVLPSKQQAPPIKKVVPSNNQPATMVPKKELEKTEKQSIPAKKQLVQVGKQPVQAGKQSVPIVKQPTTTGKQSAQTVKEALPTTKQPVPAVKPTVPLAKNLTQAVKTPATKQPTKPVQAVKQPTKTSNSAIKQKNATNSSGDTNSHSSHTDQTRKQIQAPGPSDIDSDSSEEVVAVITKKGQEKDKEKAGDKGKSLKASDKKTDKTSNSGSKEDGESGSLESESASESSSESESEPRMTLSERFAKLTQMNTDKREFAKPVLSVSEIDTKLKVVKDLRGPTPETKIYVDRQNLKQDNWNNKSRPKSPVFGDGESRYPSDESRRHFERMSRDTPSERPADWSDITVRYNYYRDRGCFDERPLTLEEYSKWEAWYYEYKDWLQNEELYSQQIMQEQQQNPQIREQEFNMASRIGYQRGLLGDAPERTVRSSMSSRLEQRIVRSPNNRPYYDDRNNNLGNIRGNDRFARRIGHAPSGSLVVNIRQENNFGRQQQQMQRGRRLGTLSRN